LICEDGLASGSGVTFMSFAVLIGFGLVVTAFVIALLIRRRPIVADVVMFFMVVAGVAIVALATARPY
jgi:hypothetical protein